ncbi:MAG: DUF924 domain-containing protein [Rhizobiaceae bacterium]|nr:DUF924 domain-containing protein [Rhizobiaceae bacterium]
MEEGWRDRVLKFWFEELTQKDWFAGGDELDAKIRDRFAELHAKLAKGAPPEARTDPETALAAVIVLDQFSRNMFRKKPEAFAADSVALDIARGALDAGLDAKLPEDRRWFLYMPFMHSEVLTDQERCVDLFKQTGGEDSIKYAVEHRDIIARFGRFPHRNRALGRESTPDELAFLEGHEGYGQ